MKSRYTLAVLKERLDDLYYLASADGLRFTAYLIAVVSEDVEARLRDDGKPANSNKPPDGFGRGRIPRHPARGKM